MNNVRSAIEIPEGTRGFDCNAPVWYDAARAFFDAGHRFVCRYVPRVTQRPIDVTAAEVADLHRAGLAVMPVQHVEQPGWAPSAAKGTEYGRTAAASAQDAGIVAGTCCWLDLEGVGVAPAAVIVAYCNAWHDAVAAEGYTPGIYVGFQARLSPDLLYRALRFEHYWAAYNLNADEYPAVRGVQMQQSEERRLVGIAYDPDLVSRDQRGGLPLADAPAEWAV